MTRSYSLCRMFRLTSLLALVLLVGCSGATPVVAEEPADGEQSEPADSSQASESSDAADVPEEATADELIEFAQELMRSRPEGETAEEQMAAARKTLSTLLKTSEQLLEKAEQPQHELFGFQLKVMALESLGQLGDEKAAARLKKEIAKAKKSDDPQLAQLAWQMYVGSLLRSWPELSGKEKDALREELLAQVEQDGASAFDVSLVRGAASELSDYDSEFARQLLEASLPLFRESDDEEVVAAAGRLEGLSRRLNLPGNELEISGELLSGGEVDWESYRGKVVLVDFWATWCGPCRQEVPNILEMYDAYHEKGFDVLGISLDKTAEKAEEYIEENEIPWASLFPKDEDQRGWDHPLVEYYAINGIPTAILVDADGRVVDMNARGRNLREQLQKLLGDPVEQKEEPADSESKEEADARS